MLDVAIKFKLDPDPPHHVPDPQHFYYFDTKSSYFVT